MDMAYFSKRKTDQDARELVVGLHTYFKNYGGRDVKPGIALQDTRMIEIMGSFDLMFSVGPYFAGVHEASDGSALAPACVHHRLYGELP